MNGSENPLVARSFLRSYLFTEDEILVIQIVSPAYLILPVVLVIGILFVLTGVFGGFIIGLASGTLSWIAATLYLRRSRQSLTRLPLDQLMRRGNVRRVKLSEVEKIGLKGRTVTFVADRTVYIARIDVPQQARFLSLIASTQGQVSANEVEKRPSRQSSMEIVHRVFAFLLLGVAILGIFLFMVGNFYSFGPTTSSDTSFAFFETGLLLTLGAPAIYGIWKPSFMAPVPRWFALIGLVFLNLSVAINLLYFKSYVSILPFLEAIGFVLTTCAATYVPIRLIQSRIPERDPTQL